MAGSDQESQESWSSLLVEGNPLFPRIGPSKIRTSQTDSSECATHESSDKFLDRWRRRPSQSSDSVEDAPPSNLKSQNLQILNRRPQNIHGPGIPLATILSQPEQNGWERGDEQTRNHPEQNSLFTSNSQEAHSDESNFSENVARLFVAPYNNTGTLWNGQYGVSNSSGDYDGSYGLGDALEVDLADPSPGNFSDPTSDATSLDSSIIRNVNKSLATANAAPDSSQGKFPYLSMYETFARVKYPKRGGTMFSLEGLDDYTRFLKQSAIEERISDKIRRTQPFSDANILTVVDSEHLAQCYTPKESDLVDSVVNTRHRLRLPWNREKDVVYATTDDLSVLNVAGPSSDSSDSVKEKNTYLHRKLKIRHLQMISFGGTLGVGLYLNSGKALTIAGGLGTLLAFMIVGTIVLATISSFSEMVTFVSIVDGVSGLSSRFVDESFGFATGWLYFISFSVGLAAEIVASTIILSYFPQTRILSNTWSTVGYVTLFLLFCALSNLITVEILGEIEYISSFIKVVVTLLFIILMIIINRGGLGKIGAIGFRYWNYNDSQFDHNLIFGPFRPAFNLRSNGLDSESTGITGNTGRFLAFLVAMLIVAYAYSGTEIVCIAACEAKEPRKALPTATKRVFWRILLFYCLASFVVSLNVYAGDPRLLRYYSGRSGIPPTDFNNNYAINYVGGNNCNVNYLTFAGISNGAQSPWVVAFLSAGLCGWSSVANGFLFFFALSCGNSQLYASSRTMYSLALQNKAPKFLKRCNRHGIPYWAVLVAMCPALTAYMCVSELATYVFQNMTSVTSSSGVLVWFSMCLSFIRFYYGLQKRPDIISRDDKAYPYRSPFQPYLAMYGVVGSGIMLLSMGFVVFLSGFWNTMFFFASYGAVIIFAMLYILHRMIEGSSMLSLEALDFDSGRREADIFVWDGGKEYNTWTLKGIYRRLFIIWHS